MYRGLVADLIWLGDICKDDIDHWDEHSVLGWVPGILDDGNDIWPLLCHVDKVSPWRPDTVNDRQLTDKTGMMAIVSPGLLCAVK